MLQARAKRKRKRSPRVPRGVRALQGTHLVLELLHPLSLKAVPTSGPEPERCSVNVGGMIPPPGSHWVGTRHHTGIE